MHGVTLPPLEPARDPASDRSPDPAPDPVPDRTPDSSLDSPPDRPPEPSPDSTLDANVLLARGDLRGAIEALMDEHGDVLLGYCSRVLRDPVLAEDVLQQVFFEAHRDLDQFQGRSSLRTWLFRIAYHRCQDAIRSRVRRDRIIGADDEAVVAHADPAPMSTDRLERDALLEALEECLALLSDEVRMTVLLRYQSELTYTEMSRSLEKRSDALHARVARALPVLRRCLENKGWADD